MTEIFVLKPNDVYGFFELKKNYTRNYSIGTALAIFLHLLFIGAFYLTETYKSETTEEKSKDIVIRSMEDIPQVPIVPIIPHVEISGSVAAPKVGIPVPVHDDEVSDNQILPTQTEIGNQHTTLLGLENGTIQLVEKIEPDEKVEILPNEKDFVPVEKLPEIVRSVQPEYPEIARRAGITGKVFVKVLVDKAGKPRKAVVIKSDSELFNQSVIDASMKSAFTPALQNQQPIAVWIVLPFRFTLEGQN